MSSASAVARTGSNAASSRNFSSFIPLIIVPQQPRSRTARSSSVAAASGVSSGRCAEARGMAPHALGDRVVVAARVVDPTLALRVQRRSGAWDREYLYGDAGLV